MIQGKTRHLRLEILRERYHNKASYNFEEEMLQLKQNPKIQQRINEYLALKKNTHEKITHS